MIVGGFELACYQQLLRSGLEFGYQFLSFADIGKERTPRTCLLRHDIDSELLGCAEMLDIEKSLGVRATYFLMTRSTAYNLFSVEGTAMVRRMLEDGHRIGLHFMGERCERMAIPQIIEDVLHETEWLEREFGTKIQAVSFHQPTRAILDAQIVVPGLINTYHAEQMASYFYVSDTNMTWRHEHPVEIFSRGLYQRLQLLIHPMWWTVESLSTLDKWRAVLRNNQRVVVDHWRVRERTFTDIDFNLTS
jgi:peptidoglycan/xylan/chitin deacetylase (PgdA/CDA1 family)